MEDSSFDTLSSERLIIRRFRPVDASAFAAYRSSPEVARYQDWDCPFSVAQAERFIESLRNQAPGTPGSWFQFAVAIAPSGPLIGDCAFRATRRDPRQAELGFTFATTYQGRGYASEAVATVLQYAFRTLALHRVFAITDVRNGPAYRLLERLRFRREGHFQHNSWFKGEWSSEFLYAQLQEEWGLDGAEEGAE